MELSAIHKAVSNSDVTEVSRILREYPVAVHERDELEWTPLHRVGAQGDRTTAEHRRIGELLLAAGADVNARDIAGQTPLHLIAMNGSAASVSVAALLLTHGADVRAESKAGSDWHLYWQHGAEIRDLILAYERRLSNVRCT